MKNLDIAMDSMDDAKANATYNKVKKATSDGDYSDSISSVIYESVKKIGGYSNGSDIYDNGDTAFAMDLLNISSGSDWSMDYDQITDIKEAYAGHINGEMKDFDLADTKAFKVLFKDLDDDVFDGTIEELAGVFKRSTDFANDVYENLNQPRG